MAYFQSIMLPHSISRHRCIYIASVIRSTAEICPFSSSSSGKFCILHQFVKVTLSIDLVLEKCLSYYYIFPTAIVVLSNCNENNIHSNSKTMRTIYYTTLSFYSSHFQVQSKSNKRVTQS